MKQTFKMLTPIVIFAMLMSCSMLSCKQSTKQPQVNNEHFEDADSLVDVPLVEKVITAEEQAKLTPDSVLQVLKEGNVNYVKGELTIRNHTERIRQAVFGQYPKAVILSCMDSRVPVEDVFNRGLGSLFVIRVAGSIVNEDILGSLEYGCNISGAKLILVLGHEYCGAIKATIDNTQLGNITALLSKIRPAVTTLKHFEGDKTSKNQLFVHAVCEQNVKLAIEAIRSRSKILKQMEQKGEIKIVGAIYNMKTGKVDFED